MSEYKGSDTEISNVHYKFKLYAHFPELEDDEGYIATDLSNGVETVVLHYNYATAAFPFYYVKVILTKAQLYKIQKYSSSVLFLIEFDKFKPVSKDPEIVKKDYYSSSLFKAIDISKMLVHASSAIAPEDSNIINDNSMNFPLELYLFKKEHLIFNKYMNAYVFSETNLASVISYLINQNFKSPTMKFFVGPIDNNKIYEQIMIPPSTFMQALRYLQKMYGVFNNGLRVFLDFKEAFIMDKNFIIETATDTTNVLIEIYHKNDTESASINNLSGYDEEEDRYIIRTNSLPIIVHNSDSKREISGENIKISSTTNYSLKEENRFKLDFVEQEVNDKKRTKERNYWNPYTNPLLESEFKVDIAKDYNIVVLNLGMVDLEIFSINRNYIIKNINNADYTNFDGEYQLIDLEVLMFPQTTATSRMKAKCTFQKIIHSEDE